jgi:hypothetical protein
MQAVALAEAIDDFGCEYGRMKMAEKGMRNALARTRPQL